MSPPLDLLSPGDRSIAPEMEQWANYSFFFQSICLKKFYLQIDLTIKLITVYKS